MSDDISLGNGITINVNDGYDKHMEIIGYSSCSMYEPKLELIYPNEEGTNRYMSLHYNGNKQLKRIEYWDVNPKYDPSACYFSQHPIWLGYKYLYIRSFWSRMCKSITEI